MKFASRAFVLRPLGVQRAVPARAALFAVALLVLSSLAPRPSAAAWPPSPLTNVPLCVTTASSQVTAAIPDGQGGAISVWYEDRAADFDVFVRRVDATGTPRWTADGTPVVTTAPVGSAQVLPKAVGDGVGGVIVVWLDGRTGVNTLYAQRIDSTGTRLWSNAGVLVATSTSQASMFDVAADGSNGVVVTWSAQPGLSSDIYAQRLNGLGAQQWTAAGRLLCNLVSDQFNPRVVRKASGVFVVVWEDMRTGFRNDLYGQALNATGTVQWAANGLLVAGSASNAINPFLVATGANDCLLLWDADSLGTGDVRVQRLGVTGAPVWGAAGVRLFSIGVSGLSGATADGAGGAFAIVNALDSQTLKSPLWINRIHDQGIVMMGPAGLRVSSIASNQVGAVITTDGGTGCIVAWFDDQRNLTPNFDLFAQRLASNGAPQWAATGVPVCRAPNQSPGLAIAPGSTGGAVLTWSDTRTSPSPDVYAQGVDTNGVLGVGLGVGVGPDGAAATTALARPSPNPAPHGATTIAYTLTARERVQLNVIDPAGRIVSVLEDGMREAGQHHVAWDGRASGRTLPPGLYLVQLRTPSRSEIRRLVLL